LPPTIYLINITAAINKLPVQVKILQL